MVETCVSRVIHAPIGTVWETVRDFDSVEEWLPPTEECVMEDGAAPTEVGGVRKLTNADGSSFREKLLEHSDLNHSRRYTVVSGLDQVQNYRGQLRFIEVTEGDVTLGEWSNSYEFVPDTPGEVREEIQSLLEEFFNLGLDNLDDMLS